MGIEQDVVDVIHQIDWAVLDIVQNRIDCNMVGGTPGVKNRG
jgi:hypothetical protein